MKKSKNHPKNVFKACLSISSFLLTLLWICCGFTSNYLMINEEYQGVSGSAPDLYGSSHGDGQTNKKRQFSNSSSTGMGQRVAVPCRQLGSSHLVLKLKVVGMVWNKSFCTWDTTDFLQSWTIPASYWNRYKCCETVSVDLRAKVYLICMHHGCTISSRLTLSLTDTIDSDAFSCFLIEQ